MNLLLLHGALGSDRQVKPLQERKGASPSTSRTSVAYI